MIIATYGSPSQSFAGRFRASIGASSTTRPPTHEFVAALTEAGYLAALIPEEYGDAGLPLSAAAAILEEVQRAGCNGAACHAQMYIMGAVLRHGNDMQKRTYLPKIATGELRFQSAFMRIGVSPIRERARSIAHST